MVRRDVILIRYIKKHYSELVEELKLIPDYDAFCNNKVVNKAIKLDLLQIGENVNHLSDNAKLQIKKSDLSGVIALRNQVAHGYVQLDEESIWSTLNNDLPRLMEGINNIK